MINDLNGEEIIGSFLWKRTAKIKLKRISDKNLKKKEIYCMSNGKVMKIHLIAGLTKKSWYKMSQCFPKYFLKEALMLMLTYLIMQQK